MFSKLDEDVIDRVLDNLLVLPAIEYHAEEVLAVIAQRTPEKVIGFFCRRTEFERDKGDSEAEFEAIPYEFHKIQEPLSRAPHAAVNLVLKQFQSDSSLFTFRGARLLRNIFPTVTGEFEAELLNLVRQGGELNLEFVLSVLRNYHGEPFVHRLCREIVTSIPSDSALRNEVAIVLETTGVVSGEFGMAEAYERKRKEVLDWITDPDERVQSFAQWYVAGLERMRDAERKRAEEDIALRKFQYGEE
jgi:hypothetical protein